jgi:LuxR family maltose regulon positive regulatory protein
VAVSLCLRGEAEICALREDYRVDSLLADMYFDRLAPEEQAQLLPFALFDAVSEGNFSAMTGLPITSAQRELIHRTPLIRYDATAGVYYPHVILRDFLTIRLNNAPEDIRNAIYLGAGKWHADRGNLCQAIACFYAVKAYGQILALPLVNLCLAKAGQVSFETVAREMLASCPRELWAAYPIALLRIAYYLFAATDFAGYGLAMDKAREVVEASGDQRLMGEWLVMDALSVYPDAAKMGERWAQAEALIAGRCRVIAPEEPFLFGCPSMWYIFYTTPGAGDRIGQELESAITHYNAFTGGHAGGADVLYRAELASIRGEYEEAQQLAYQAAQLSEDARQPTVTFGAALLLGRIAISRSDLAGIEAAVDYLENKAAVYPFMRGSAMNGYMLDTVRAMMRSMMEQTRQAPAWTRQGAQRDESLSIGTLMTRHAYVSEVMLDRGYNRAIGIMEATLRLDGRLCNTVTKYYLYVGLALSYLGLIRRGKAIEALDKALAIGAPDGMVSIFVHHRKVLSLLFVNADLQRKYGAFIARIMGIRGSFTGTSFSDLVSLCHQELPDSLTDRERQIAELAAQGMRNREIAQREFISEYTVRNHLKNIFSKLDIDRRAKLADLLKP